MFLHEFKYEMKRTFRQKEELFWVVLFPILLGTLFHLAFSNINNSTETFHTIPVAVCRQDGQESAPFEETLRMLSEEGEPPFLSLTETDASSAEKLLKENQVRGIFTIGEEISLTCTPADSKNSTLSMEQSILETFLREYETCETAITDVLSKHPDKAEPVLALLDSSDSFGKELSLTDSSMDGVVSYFFNLIAMACLFTSFAGSQISMKNQANLSTLGARKCASPSGKFISVTAQLLSNLLAQFLCISVDILFLRYVLGVDFGSPMPLLLLTSFFGCMMGIAFGFFIGSIGRVGEAAKTGILISVSLTCCFFSGLMISNMRSVVESVFPVFNDINPAVLISDGFLSLNIYGLADRYMGNLISLCVITVVFIVAGCLMIRRKTYASL